MLAVGDLDTLPPGTVLRGPGEEHIVVSFDDTLVSQRGFIAMRAAADWEVITLPSAHPSLRRSVSAVHTDVLVPFVSLLALGTVFVEISGDGTRTRAVKLWGSDIIREDDASRIEMFRGHRNPLTIDVVGTPVSPPDEHRP